ncbi:unnamed protein product [Rotaria socialis]|uniref:Uncharacterized protein n=1 Tax=Rotaria socialis TaxID=392032 RepID=A0A818G7W0_9BILA|nr:unnamed protein product [Rotaria socialis]CAF3178518.1 unnamed protein product [Rotaria socialis]CAF3323872.1 unnamed protein product [Rotaria socialis]CAF3330908.1 unnamed protein product [Rotaria socialis]CAF3487287.1 unnamed protein product [Rotaria socialis]
MYDRAPRSFQLKIGCTPDHVGPGTYDQRRKKIAEESYAPFLSLSNRGNIFSSEDNPGPGYYDIRNAPSPTIKVRLDNLFRVIFLGLPSNFLLKKTKRIRISCSLFL